ncbi:hypothetical protein FOCG_17530 [Fusarium oxysporum f. sp. radicis-lycopersici 26381]|nr:hypothetical protein FOCG_17530 [Fusarium oxysporum f. sp. radicis-lycopersici 26381]
MSTSQPTKHSAVSADSNSKPTATPTRGRQLEGLPCRCAYTTSSCLRMCCIARPPDLRVLHYGGATAGHYLINTVLSFCDVVCLLSRGTFDA